MINFKRSTILLTKDILRRDYLRCYNSNSNFDTKNIDKLAKEGTFFSDYYCAAPSSGMAATCTFSGLNAYQLDRKIFGETKEFTQKETIFNILESNNIETHVLWPAEFEHLAYVHSKVFDTSTKIHYAPRGGSVEVSPQQHAFKKLEKGKKSSYYDLAKYFLDYIKDLSSNCQKPWFLWCHSPHVFKPFDSYGSDIGHFDDFVGKISDEIDADIILSGDHGHSICEKGRITYGFDVYQGSVHIPLITPNYFKKSVINYPVSQTQLKQIVIEKTINRNKFVYADTQYYVQPNRKLMIVQDSFKYIYNKIDGSEELYDLEYDPHENINLLVEYWPDNDRNSAYKLDEVVYYPNWDTAKEYYISLKSEKEKIWRNGGFLEEKIYYYAQKLRNSRKVGFLKIFKRQSNNLIVKGRWGCMKAKVNLA